MKKVFLLVAVVAAFSFVSCKKDRTCTCTRTVSTSAGSTSSTSIITYNKTLKKDARLFCLSTTETDNGVTTTEDCELK